MSSSLSDTQLQLKFIDPDQKLDGENKSKLLCPDSELFQWINKIRSLLTQHDIKFDARTPHIELVSQSNEPLSVIQSRANHLHRSFVKKELSVMHNKALVIYTGIVNMYGMTHTTVAYFKESINERQYLILLKMIDGIATEQDIMWFIQEQQDKSPTQTHKEWKRDWWCSTCKFKIFGSKAECKKCGSKRPN